MLLDLIGWFYLIFGVLYLVKPTWLQERLKKKSVRKVKRLCFVLALILSSLLIKATWGASGIAPKIIMILGFIGIFKAVFLLKAKAADTMIEWWLNQPPKFFRICSIAMLVFGAVLVYVI